MVDLAKNDPETLTNSSEEIKKAVDRGAGLVRQILTFARQTAANLEPLQVNGVIQDMVGWLKEKLPVTMKLNLELRESLPELKADRAALTQAIQNLCVNARDAMNPGGGTLTIMTTLTTAEELTPRFDEVTAQRYVGIHVKDTGIGMDKSILERIFEPFFTTKESTHGSGLGLAVVYGVVRSHNGHVDVESEPGKGTTFHIFLPVAG